MNKKSFMGPQTKSIRPFIGTKNYEISRNFYRDLGFEETIISSSMCLFTSNSIAFYLQDAYIKDWIDNTMVFVEVANVTEFWTHIQALDLTSKFENIKLVPIRHLPWGRECFVHDPSGILWHFGQFNSDY